MKHVTAALANGYPKRFVIDVGKPKRLAQQLSTTAPDAAKGFCRGGGTSVISGWGCAAGTLEPLAYTRASSAEFCYPILEFLKSLLS